MFAYSSEGDTDAFVMYTAKLVVIFIVEIAYFCIFIDMFVIIFIIHIHQIIGKIYGMELLRVL